MSIEALIQAHIEALNTNTKAVELLTLSLAGRTPKAEDKLKAKSEPMVHDVKKLEEEHKPATKKEEPKIEEKSDVGITASVPYETVRAMVLKLAPTQRDAIKALNAKHGIANLKVLLDKEDDFSTVNDQVKLEAVYADLQALEA